MTSETRGTDQRDSIALTPPPEGVLAGENCPPSGVDGDVEEERRRVAETVQRLRDSSDACRQMPDEELEELARRKLEKRGDL